MAAKRTPGQRGYLGPDDLLRVERQTVGRWARLEEDNGHVLTRSDLFNQFRFLVSVKKQQLTDRKNDLAAEPLTDHEEKVLQFCQERLTAWQKESAKAKAALKLLKQTGFRERSTNVLLQLSEAEVTKRLAEAWRYWDFVTWLVAVGSPTELQDFVSDPFVFAEHRRQSVVIMTDQVQNPQT